MITIVAGKDICSRNRLFIGTCIIITCLHFSISYASDLKFKARDSQTGQVVSEYEKTYIPEEREQTKQREQLIHRQQIEVQKPPILPIPQPNAKTSKTTDAMQDKIELEKRRLKELLERAKRESTTGSALHQEFFKAGINNTQKNLKEIEEDPEYYFYKKQEREKNDAARPVIRNPTPPPPIIIYR
jgi:hypothetical protein